MQEEGVVSMNKKLKVKGMHCASCEVLIKDSLQEIGVSADVNVPAGEVILKNFDEKKMDMKKIIHAIEENGYTVP